MTKFILFPMIFCLLSINLFSQDTDLSQRLVDYYKMKTQSQQSKTTQSHHDHLWKTVFLRELGKNWDDLDFETKSMFAELLTGPELEGDVQTYIRGDLMFHYTYNSGISNQDVSAVDEDENGIPDYVEFMADQFDISIDKYHNELGLTKPLLTALDDHENEEAFYHVYISNDLAGNGIYGYVNAFNWSYIYGDNPNSPDVVEYDAIQTYMTMRSNYDDFGDEKNAISVTAAHEYMHAIIFGYDYDVNSWLHEAMATWGEEYIFPEVDDNYQYMHSIFNTPDVALNYDNLEGDEFQGHWYGTFLFIKYLTEQTNDQSVALLLIKMIRNDFNPSAFVEAMNAILINNYSDRFGSIDRLFEDYALSITICSADKQTFGSLVYNDGDEYRAVIDYFWFFNFYREAIFDFSGEFVEFNSQFDGNNRLMRFGFDPFVLNTDKNFEINFQCDNPEVELVLVKYTETDSEIEYASSDGSVVVNDVDDWDQFYIVVIRKDELVTDIETQNYGISISELQTSNFHYVDNELIVYPNPADEAIFIQGFSDRNEVKVFDCVGHLVIQKSNVDCIDVHHLASGYYLMRIESEGRGVSVRQVLIR